MTDPLNILLHSEAQLLDWGESRSIGPWIKLRLQDPEQLEVFRGMDTATATKTGHIMHVTLAEGDIATLADATESTHPYGNEARELKVSGFFRCPLVWGKIGSPGEYADWLTYCKSWISGNYNEHKDGVGRSIACHVRRIAKGAGTAYKPGWWMVPMTHTEHSIQHQNGELECLVAYEIFPEGATVEQAKDCFDQQVIKHLEQWGWEILKAQLGFEHWYDVPPGVLWEWAAEHKLINYLPRCYHKADE